MVCRGGEVGWVGVEGVVRRQTVKQGRVVRKPVNVNPGLNVKDVRANCFCASLLRTQIHMPRHASSARAKY